MTPLKTTIKRIRDSGATYDYILAPARGGLMAAQFIAYALGIETIHTINNVRGGYPRSQANQRVLMVDDINDTSETMGAIKDHMLNNQLCMSIDVAVLYERKNAPLKADYVGEIIHHNDWVHFTWDKEL